MDQKHTSAVRAFYEAHPYPDFSRCLKSHFRDLKEVLQDFEDRTVRYLDAGCGTGHGTVGMAVRFPRWECYGVDLSATSIRKAEEVAASRRAVVRFAQADFTEQLPFSGPFDFITSFGAIHHCDDPASALAKLGGLLSPDGLLVVHLYGREQDRQKFLLRELLDLLSPRREQYEERFRYYRALRPPLLGGFMDCSLRELIRTIGDTRRTVWAWLRGEHRVPKWHARYTKPDVYWRDHFCHPCEHAFDIRDVRALAESANIRVVQMLNLPGERIIPVEIRDAYQQLNCWDRWRMEEILARPKKSILFVAKRGDSY